MFVHRISSLSRTLQVQRISRFSSKDVAQHSDVFGIADVTGKDVMGTRETEELDRELFEKKYAYLNNLNKLDNVETVLHNPVGHIRFDKDNQPKYHGQFDEDNEKIRFDLQALESFNLGKDQVADPKKEGSNTNAESTEEFNRNFKLASLLRKDQASQQEARSPKQATNRPYRIKVDTSNVDIYDFEPIKKDFASQKGALKKTQRRISLTEFKLTDQWVKWIERDSLLYISPLARLLREKKMVINPMLAFKYEELTAGKAPEQDAEPSYSPLKGFESIENELKGIEQEEDQLKLDAMTGDEPIDETETGGMNLRPIFEQDILKKLEEQRSAERAEDDESDGEEPSKKKISISQMTALDYLRKLKNKEIEPNFPPLKELMKKKSEKASVSPQIERPEFDSKGFKNYRHQVLNLYTLNDADRALFLEGEIIFNNLGIVVVNKPYGITCPGDNDRYVTEKNKKIVRLNSFLGEFAQLVAMQDKQQGKENTFEDLSNPILYPIYKLDRNCTGVYVLAKNKETTKKVHELFKQRKVSLFYDAITKNVPKEEKASIDIPIDLNRRDPNDRMVLKPEVPEKYRAIIRPSKTADKAVTNYKVLKAHKSAAYVELNPLTSIRHQIRVHLGFGLRTPILGDHLYDTPVKVDYQKLPLDMLLNLNIRPTKTMHIPLHLHCKLIILNEFGHNGRDIFLKADLPHFFIENLRSLKLN